MGILVITTGGTIGALAVPDPTRPPAYTPMPPDGFDIVGEALHHPPFNKTEIRCISMPPLDSKDINNTYRQTILDVIDQSAEKETLLTHGTDRLLASADYFYPLVTNKVLIITGAMTPLANGPSSDGYMNLAFALAQLRGDTLQPGVYVVLCDYHDDKSWQPRLYRHEPGVYEKLYVADGRYNRIRRIES